MNEKNTLLSIRAMLSCKGCFKTAPEIRYAREFFSPFISKSVNNQCYTTHTFLEISFRATTWSKENGRIRKFIAVNFSLKIETFKLKLSAMNFRIP